MEECFLFSFLLGRGQLFKSVSCGHVQNQKLQLKQCRRISVLREKQPGSRGTPAVRQFTGRTKARIKSTLSSLSFTFLISFSVSFIFFQIIHVAY